MCLYNRTIPPAAETPEHMPEAKRFYRTPGVFIKYKIITPTISYYIEADSIEYCGDYIVFKIGITIVACISLNTAYGFIAIEQRAASSEGQA